MSPLLTRPFPLASYTNGKCHTYKFQRRVIQAEHGALRPKSMSQSGNRKQATLAAWSGPR